MATGRNCCPPREGLLAQEAVCVDVGGVVYQATRYRLFDPVTLATLAERTLDNLTGADLTGTPVACDTAASAGIETVTARYDAGALILTVDGVPTTVSLGAQLVQDAFGAPQGYFMGL